MGNKQNDRRLKIVRQFPQKLPIDRLVQNWARAEGFKSGNPSGAFLMDENNHAYCFHKSLKEAVMCVLIDSLDDCVRIEAWKVDMLLNKKNEMKSISHLLDMLEMH